jgi:hypothetical protein
MDTNLVITAVTLLLVICGFIFLAITLFKAWEIQEHQSRLYRPDPKDPNCIEDCLAFFRYNEKKHTECASVCGK